MDWKQILSLSNENLTDERKEEIYNELVKDQKFDSKIAKKLFPLCLNILKFKGQQVEKQRDEIEMLASSDIDLKSTLEQIEKQKITLSKYEAERIQFKARIKELSDEIALIHGRELQGSGEDSPDQLSEIDKQQELMSKISAKNKHIKRLLRDIEKHEQETASYLNVIKNMKMTVEQANEKISQLETQLTESNAASAFLEDKLSQLSQQLLEQEQENKQLMKEREEREKEVQNFSSQVEERCMRYKQILNEKQNEVDLLKERYEKLVEQVPGMDVDGVEIENKRLIDSSKEKDELIRAYEEKFQLLSSELMDSTETIRKLIDTKEELEKRLSQNRSDDCCRETRAMLEKSNQRNIELQEMLEKADEDNILKSKQAFEAIETLRSYENSTDGLADALKKIHQLQETVHQRDKQIRELVVEVNMQNEVSAENSILRKRLGLPDDEIIETKAFMAKQKRFAKINERIMLKLRASEEMRLQLKIDKHELKRKITALEKRLNGEVVEDDDELNQSYAASECSETSKFKSTTRKESNLIEMKQCRNCSTTFNVYERTHKFCRNCIMSQNLCENCTINYKETSTENIALIKKIAKLEIDHQSVVEENENLRTGLSEILKKLQNYDGSSEKAIVNPATLEKLLYILKLSSSMKSLVQETSQTVAESNVTASALEVQQNDIEDMQDENLQLKLLIEKLSNENDEMKLNLEKMNILQKQYEEIVRSSELSDDDKHQLLVKSLERCHEFETNLKAYERKIDFLMNENDNLHREMRMLKVSSLELVNEMKMEILSKTEEMMTIDIDENEENENDIIAVEEELQQLRLELNGFCFNVLKNIKTLDNENILEAVNMEQLSNVTIIENNLTTNFITRRELDSLKSTLTKMKETINAHEMREKHLEELTKIAQHQLKSQQLMLTKLSEDEIVTRHLLVDLQSQSDENYLLTKTTRELTIAKENEDHMRLENDKLKSEIIVLEEKLLHARNTLDEKRRECLERESGNLLKIQYLKKSLVDLRNNYSTLTPIYLIADFIKHYSALLDAKKQFELTKINSKSMPEVSHDSLVAQLKEMSMTDIEAKIEIVKQKSSCDYLKHQLELHEATIRELHNEIERIKINEVKSNQHWDAIRLLFDETKDNQDDVHIIVTNKKMKFDKETQIDIMRNDCGTNTENELIPQQQQVIHTVPQTLPTDISVEVNQAPIQPALPVLLSPDGEEISLDQQLKKALSLAYSRSSLLIETENQLSELQGRIRVLEKSLENQRTRENDQKQPDETHKGEDHVMITITTLQNVMIEKDATISRYQEILKSERQEHMRLFDENNEQIKQLKKVIDSHEMTIDERNKSIEKLKASVSELNEKLEASAAALTEAETKPVMPVATNNETTERDDMEMKLKETHTEIKKMEQQIKDFTNTERLMQNILNEREVTIKELNIKLKAANDNLETLSENITSASPEIDGLREMLEEKDKHIQDLTETLNQFHDDQQKYITDSALTSAEQATMMSANLARSETKIRVLETQVEAMKRQMLNLQQREKSSRDLIKTLKNQLIRRPVISVKSDKRPASSHREEQQQKRIAELENELLESKDELRRQININDNKKAKNAAELGLWDKQKRYQEMSEKLKAKLTEREIDLERLKANLQMAKNTVKRLENENKMLDNKIKSGQYLQKISPCQFCKQNANAKQTDSSSALSVYTDFSDDHAHELVATLKNRVESLTRRNVALELENKSPSQISAEFEKLCEKLSKTEAKVIRLESTNAQLQIEIDLANQRNRDKSQEGKLKHLEDYIIVLKEELAQARVAASSIMNLKGNEHPESKKINEMEQTILQLKNIVDRQRVEIKHLRNPKSRTTTSSSNSSIPPTLAYMNSSDRKKEEIFDRLKTEHDKLQTRFNELYSDHVKLQMENEILKSQEIGASCPHCNQKSMDEMATQDIDTLKYKLQQRDIALQKAKVLIQRHQTREKQFKEIISNLKKKICFLEGVPVISEENSECGIENISNLS